jgi:hypothetical protein
LGKAIRKASAQSFYSFTPPLTLLLNLFCPARLQAAKTSTDIFLTAKAINSSPFINAVFSSFGDNV